ncbi:MAG: hypothetical protein V1495_00875 [Pseudomonadota bacterium]
MESLVRVSGDLSLGRGENGALGVVAANVKFEPYIYEKNGLSRDFLSWIKVAPVTYQKSLPLADKESFRISAIEGGVGMEGAKDFLWVAVEALGYQYLKWKDEERKRQNVQGMHVIGVRVGMTPLIRFAENIHVRARVVDFRFDAGGYWGLGQPLFSYGYDMASVTAGADLILKDWAISFTWNRQFLQISRPGPGYDYSSSDTRVGIGYRIP